MYVGVIVYVIAYYYFFLSSRLAGRTFIKHLMFFFAYVSCKCAACTQQTPQCVGKQESFGTKRCGQDWESDRFSHSRVDNLVLVKFEFSALSVPRFFGV